MTTVVYAVRRWPKRRYAAHTCISPSSVSGTTSRHCVYSTVDAWVANSTVDITNGYRWHWRKHSLPSRPVIDSFTDADGTYNQFCLWQSVPAQRDLRVLYSAGRSHELCIEGHTVARTALLQYGASPHGDAIKCDIPHGTQNNVMS